MVVCVLKILFECVCSAKGQDPYRRIATKDDVIEQTRKFFERLQQPTSCAAGELSTHLEDDDTSSVFSNHWRVYMDQAEHFARCKRESKQNSVRSLESLWIILQVFPRIIATSLAR